MATLLEVLVTSDSNNAMWTCNVWDHHTGTSLMTYKGGGSAESKTLSFIGNDYIAAVQKAKPILHVWPLNSHQTVQGIRFILPGKANAFSVTKDGSFCIAGIDEKIYLWQISSGNLLTIISRHYQEVKHLVFTPDGKYFVSAGDDGMVMVWALATVATHPEVELVTQKTAGHHDPVHIFTDHSLPVTDLCVSKTGMHGRLCTVSMDRSCKIYDMASGEMLLNLVFDVALSAITFDVLELNVFVGTTEGNIHTVPLTHPPRNRDMLVNTEKDCPTFSSHKNAVTCLSASLDGETLMSGSNDETVILWHIQSKQPIRTIKHKGPVTNAFFAVNFPAIYKQDFHPKVVLHSLERTLERDADHFSEIEVLINHKIGFWSDNDLVLSSETDVPSKELENDYKQKEMALKEELEKMKIINANLYAFSIDKVLSDVSVNKAQNFTNKKKKVK